MNLNQYKEKVIETIIEPMLSFMEEWDDYDYTMNLSGCLVTVVCFIII